MFFRRCGQLTISMPLRGCFQLRHLTFSLKSDLCYRNDVSCWKGPTKLSWTEDGNSLQLDWAFSGRLEEQTLWPYLFVIWIVGVEFFSCVSLVVFLDVCYLWHAYALPSLKFSLLSKLVTPAFFPFWRLVYECVPIIAFLKSRVILFQKKFENNLFDTKNF